MLNWPKKRAWGWYATLIRTPWFCVKLLRFKPYGNLSEQRHFYRTEVWFFINDGGIPLQYFKEYRVWKIKPGEWHLFSAGDKPVYALELQYGKKVTEEDIERK